MPEIARWYTAARSGIFQSMKRKYSLEAGLYCMLFCVPTYSYANDLLIAGGYGRQPNSSQYNRQLSVDYDFFQYDRSARSRISIGVGYTRLSTDAAVNKSIDAISVYPQLTLTPVRQSLRDYYFFVRALGPTYISNNSLGDRKQDNNFSFQAQVGVGYQRRLGNNKSLLFQTSWKHFSNANWFSNNDGIDLPFVLTIGYRF